MWTAFWRLTKDRQRGMGGVGPIPWSAIDRYAERQGLDLAGTEEFVLLIEAMDDLYVEHANKLDEEKPTVKRPLKKKAGHAKGK